VSELDIEGHEYADVPGMRGADLFPLLADLHTRFPGCLARDKNQNRMKAILQDLIKTQHNDLAHRLLDLCQPASLPDRANAPGMLALRAHLAQGDLPAAATQACDLLTQLEPQCQAGSNALAKAIRALDGALAKKRRRNATWNGTRKTFLHSSKPATCASNHG
jgi:hypothetical protein